MEDIYIPERFWRAVVLHIAKNHMVSGRIHSPLILGIHGPSGEGKTFQCEHILQEIGVKSFLISGGQLESHEAGEPARLVRTTYLRAGQSVAKRECDMAVVLINDIDTGLGSWGEMVQYTINRQTVFGELMHIVDYPTSVEGRRTRRIPIIITGNDFTKLYGPLVRLGRMTPFIWKPTEEEKSKMIRNIFPELEAEESLALLKLLNEEAKQSWGDVDSLPIAFFTHLQSVIVDDNLWEEIQKTGIAEAIDLLANGYAPGFKPSLEYERLAATGKRLVRSGKLMDHLGGQ